MLDNARSANSRDAFRALAVIVLYKMAPSESAAFRSLAAAISALQGKENRIQILLCDNTPGECIPGPLPEGVRYEAAGQNAGLASAYNRALAIARSEHYAWLLTLDQDTTLPADYLSRISELAVALQADSRIAAIVPQLLDGNQRLSPMSVKFWGTSFFSKDFRGMPRGETRAFNSASLFRVRALEEVGAFDPRFWLDYVDVNLYRQLHLRRKKVYVAGDIEVQHELSVIHRADLGVDRFQNVLQAESAFFDLYEDPLRRIFLNGRLLGRLWRQRKRGDRPAIRELTWETLKTRLLHSRLRRIQEWNAAMDERIRHSTGAANSAEPSGERPAISVCLATYNGEPYIKAQIESILGQLSARDELVVVDDASSDSTCEVIENLDHPLIRVKRHAANQGVLRSFEEAICCADGEILFLSDQDDLWTADKVATILQAFHERPDIDIVVSDAALMDRNGNPRDESYYAQRGKFRSGVLANLVHCSYLGCTMALRRRILSRILPFPVGADVFHDLWIGTANALAGGKTLFVDRPLVRYRRHDGNATANRRLSLGRKLRIRWDLCRSLLQFWLRSRSLPRVS